MAFSHIPVLYKECIEGLNIRADGIYVDCTLGGGGHALGIAERLTTGRLIANDLDKDALSAAKARLTPHLQKITFLHDDYKNICENLDTLNIPEVDGILIDLGISSHQIDTPERGFSYMKAAPLDMRMNQEAPLSAYDVVNGYSEDALIRILYDYGEERFAKRIAANILKERAVKPIETTAELAAIAVRAYPASYQGGHPAKRLFQSVRIEVNGELNGLAEAVTEMARRLKKGGRMAVLTFQSLEDRIVKTAFKTLASGCECDKRLPICVCGKQEEIKLINKKPLTASPEELKENKRAESAKLRIIEKR